MKRVLQQVAVILFRLLIILLLVAIIMITLNWVSTRNLVNPQILLVLITTAGGIITGYISVWYPTHHKNQSEAKNKNVTVKGSSQSFNDLIKIYQDHLCSDPRISELKILDMHRSLKIMNIYIQVRIHQESWLSFKLDAALSDGANRKRSDPEELLNANRLRIESRAENHDAKDPVKVIEKNKRCLIVGDPGTGKTTLLKYLALKSIKEPSPHLPDFPIYIELNQLVIKLKQADRIDTDDLLNFAASLWRKRYNIDVSKEIIIRVMKERLAEGKALLLLDALDETITGETQEKAQDSYLRVIDAITNFSTSYEQVPIIVTVRKTVYRQQIKPLDGFTEFEVLEFRLDDIKQFVHNWFVNYHKPQNPANFYDLIDHLEQNPRVQALATNPLLLSLMVVVYEANLDLPDRRAALYRQCVAALMAEWDKIRRIERRSNFSLEHKSKLLEEVAWHFHCKGQCYFSEDELLKVIANFPQRLTKKLFQGQEKDILAEITAEHGLLKEQIKGLYGFLHLTLQEYFVALYAIEHNQIDTLLAHRGDSWWEEVILLYAGCTTDLSPLLQNLSGHTTDGLLQEDFFKTNLILAGRSLATRPDYPEDSLRSEVIQRLFDELSNTIFSLTRARIVDVLVEVGGEYVNNRLLSLFFNKQTDPAVRQSIARGLSSQGEQAVATILIERLADSQTDAVSCQDIAEVLGMINEPSVAPRLLDLFAHSRFAQNIDVRLSIVAALGMLGKRSITHTLLENISHTLFGHISVELNARMRQGIIEALGELGDYSIIPELVQLLSTEVDHSVRGSIAYALGVLGKKALTDPLLQKYMVKIEKGKEGVHRSIREALGEPLVNILFQAQNQLMKKRIAHIYQNFALSTGRYIANVLLQELFNAKENAHVRQCAAEALGVLGEHSVARTLAHLLLTESKSYIRGTVAYILGLLGEKAVAGDLLQSLSQERDIAVRQNIATALGMLGESSIVSSLKTLLSREKDSSIRGSIAAALGKLETDSMTLELRNMLLNDHLDPIVCRRIADALSTSGVQSSVLERLRQLANPQIDVTVYTLLRQLANPQIDVSVRKKIASILYDLNRDAAVPALLELLTDQHRQLDPPTLGHIATILEQLASDEETVRILITLLNRPDIIDSIHRVLWTVCRRAGVTIIRNTQGPFEIVKWGNAPVSLHTNTSQRVQQFLPTSEPAIMHASTSTGHKVSLQFVIPGTFSHASHV